MGAARASERVWAVRRATDVAVTDGVPGLVNHEDVPIKAFPPFGFDGGCPFHGFGDNKRAHVVELGKP